MIITSKEELVRPCQDVESLEEGYEIIEELAKQLYNEKGIGLAAPQIGIFKKVFIIYNTQNKSRKEFFGFMNPKIISKAAPFIVENEGCLSFPGLYINTVRFNEIEVEDIQEPLSKFTGMNAVIIQHELDHLIEKTMFDHQVPDKYDVCFCGSGVKFKFCCLNKLSKIEL